MNMIRNLRLSTAAALSPVVVFISAFAMPAAQAQVSANPDAYLHSRMDTIEENLRSATGRVEQSGFQVNQLRKRIEVQAEEISKLKQALAAQNERLKKLEALINAPVEAAANAASGPAETSMPLVGATSPSTRAAIAATRDDTDESIASKSAGTNANALPEDPGELFKQARNVLLQGDYTSAESIFEHLIETHPESDQAANAHYWLGESLILQEAYPEAAQAYITLVREYPDADKAPDGLVKLARSLRMMGDTEKACGALNQIASRYPRLQPVTRSLAETERDRANCDAN